MVSNRIQTHPILDIQRGKEVQIYWNNVPLTAYENETVASALIANGIQIFGYHQKDHSPQGIFCANGQCSQCMVIINGIPKKSCMEPVREGMQIFPILDSPEIPGVSESDTTGEKIKTIQKQVLIIGGGPAGLSAAIELGSRGIEVLLVDDKPELGGKLVLQTHRFFGSSEAVYAGTRGIEIAKILEKEVQLHPKVETWVNSTAVGVFSDKKVGILRNGSDYVLIAPDVLLVATGARERFLAFRGNTLPGVLGAGAFQTLVNRDLVLPVKKIFVIGGGNVGLIAAYHAIQAGISVVGLAEAMPTCNGYRVHRDKLMRCGVPIFTSHTVVRANGKDKVESITIAEVGRDFKPKENTEKTFAVDGILIAVGLEPVNEFYDAAKKYGLQVFASGDAEEIAEASAAFFSGKIRAVEIKNKIEKTDEDVPVSWGMTKEILASKPGYITDETYLDIGEGVYPVLHCTQKIPCDPCAHICPLGLIHIDSRDIRDIPKLVIEKEGCAGCGKCVIRCPGLAISLVDYRKDPNNPIVTLPFEMDKEMMAPGDKVSAVDTEGRVVEVCEIKGIEKPKNNSKTMLVKIQAHASSAEKIAGIQHHIPEESVSIQPKQTVTANDCVVCVCENVTANEIRNLVRKGITDLNAIKAITRAGMGACGGKTCETLIRNILREEGVEEKEIVPFSKRPLFTEVSMKYFSRSKGK